MSTAAGKPSLPYYEVAVIGAGPAGIAAGVKLRRAGIGDVAIVERADDVGGSWHANHYPGLGVDIPSLLYQYSFARSTEWSRVFACGAEVERYHVEIARRYGLYPHIRFHAEVIREVWDDARHVWRLELADGNALTARFVVSAVGAFLRPKQNPGIAGLADFVGKIQRPTDWDHDYDLRGKRVAVIGTGASSVQITPSIAPEVAQLTVFQRTPVWVLPKPDFALPSVARMMLRIPGLQAAVNGMALVSIDLVLRGACRAPLSMAAPVMRGSDRALLAAYRQYLRLVVRDPMTRGKLTPTFGPLVKRPTMSNGYLQAFNRRNVALVATPIDRFTATGVLSRDGVHREFDVIVLATGYDVFSDPESYRPGTVVGRDGRDLGEFFTTEGLQAYQSVAVPKLPNRWMLVGPYSWTGSGWHAFVEMTADHAVRAIAEARRRGATAMEIRQDAHEAYHRDIHRRGRAIRYYLGELHRDVPTYYRNSRGDSTYLRPSGFFEASRGNRRFPFDDYAYRGSTTSEGTRR